MDAAVPLAGGGAAAPPLHPSPQQLVRQESIDSARGATYLPRDDGWRERMSGSVDIRREQQKEEQATYDVSEAIEAVGFGCYQVLLMFMCSAIWVADAMEMMMLSFLSPALTCEWSLDNQQKAFISTVVFVGMCCGAPFWGWVDDAYGRRFGYFASVIFTFVAGMSSAASTSYHMLLMCRGLVGFGVSGSHVCVTLFSEFLPISWRAWGVLMVGTFWAVGAVFEALLALAVMPGSDPHAGWRILLVLSAVPLVLLLLFSPWLPESPRWDLLRGDPDRAERTLRRAAAFNGVSLPPGQLVAPHREEGTDGQVSELLRPPLRTTTLLLFPLWLVTAGTYYGVVLLNTELFQLEAEGKRCATAGSAAETPAPEGGCAMLAEEDYRDAVVDAFAELPGLFAMWMLVDSAGRRRTMAMAYAACGICLGALAMCWKREVENGWIFGARGAASGVFQVIFLYTPEVYPTRVRARALGICSSFSRVGGMLTPFLSEVLLPVSSYLALGAYAVFCLAAATIALCLPIETAGRAMTDSVAQQADAADTPLPAMRHGTGRSLTGRSAASPAARDDDDKDSADRLTGAELRDRTELTPHSAGGEFTRIVNV